MEFRAWAMRTRLKVDRGLEILVFCTLTRLKVGFLISMSGYFPGINIDGRKCQSGTEEICDSLVNLLLNIWEFHDKTRPNLDSNEVALNMRRNPWFKKPSYGHDHLVVVERMLAAAVSASPNPDSAGPAQCQHYSAVFV